MRPQKSLGQNFLVNRGIVQKIVAAGDLRADDVCVEIGPGPGALTPHLLASGAIVHAVDRDPRMIAHLQELCASELASAPPRLILHHTDILHFALPTLANTAQRFVVVGNIPYNISAPILIWLCDHAEQIDRAILTMQREVALRLIAEPSTKAYGPLSIAIQACARVERLFDISPHSFWPAPKVTSSTVRLRFPNPPPLPAASRAGLREIVRSAFMKRRKMLKASFDVDTLRAADIDPTRRAETLALDEWLRLTNAVATFKK